MTTQRKDARYGRWSERAVADREAWEKSKTRFQTRLVERHGAAALSEVFWQGF